MREMSPVDTYGQPGYYSPEDLVLQMIFYGDITAWRTARVMKVAEEDQKAGRAVLVMTENDHVEHLGGHGFAVYRPALHGIRPSADATAVVDHLASGGSIVVNTNQIGQTDKNALVRHLTDRLAGISLTDVSLVVESTEAFFPRRRSRGDTAGMDTMNNLLKRAKGERAHVVFAAESPDEIAVEIGRSCGTPVVGQTTNDDRARVISRSVDRRLWQYANQLFGLKALNANDFYIFNRHTAPRQGPGQLSLELTPTMRALTSMHTIPRWLEDRSLACGFDPNRPSKPGDPSGKKQDRFLARVQKAREEADEAFQQDIAAKAPVPAAAPALAAPVANDNAKLSKAKRPAPRTRLDKTDAIDRLKRAGIADCNKMYGLARSILNARGGRLNAPLDQRLTGRSVAQRIVADPTLREAAKAGYAVSHRYRDGRGWKVSAGAYAAAYHQAMCEDLDAARAFHEEMSVRGIRGGTRSQRAVDMEQALQRIGETHEGDARSEAQYQIVANAWRVHRALSGVLPKAA